jgi:C-terminal processing protease CtpA/Prc
VIKCALALLVVAAAAAGGEKELSHDDGKLAGKKSTAGTGHVIAFEAPKGTWWVRSILVHGARYGGGYDAATTMLTVTICDSDLKPLGATTAKYELFSPGKFEWVEIPLEEPVEAPAKLKVVVEFRPTATQGVYVGFSETKQPHSGHGVPGGAEKPFASEWMIRARLSSEKPKPPKQKKPDPGRYTSDFEFLAKTVEARFPAFKKKGIDWQAARREWRPKFAAAKDDREHVLNAMQLLALLGDMHSGVIDTKVEPPTFEGLCGAGLWIAADQGRLVLRAAVPGHPLLERVKPGAELLTIGGKPAKLVHLAVRAQAKRWHGWSSDHFLDARLGFQFFPFGKEEKLAVEFLDPSGAVVALELERWGPGGRGCSPVEATMPEGVKAEGLAVSARLDEKTGYLRILGGMNEETRAAFDKAFDELKGVDGIVLDCRGMGGGGDGPAWAMAGRFFKERTPNGTAPPLEPTGSWQFDGPVVLLQDERMVSSAETFTWAMTEGGRAVGVGRPTGGATIIPETFDAPSGLFRFRLGIHDRKTPIKGVQPEGVGTPPSLPVSYEPALIATHGDPILGIARSALDALRQRQGLTIEIALPPAREAIDWEVRLLEEPKNPMPDFVGGCHALRLLGERKSTQPDAAARAVEAAGKWAKEEAAQQACEALFAKGFPPKPAEAKALIAAHKGTRWAEALAAYVR